IVHKLAKRQQTGRQIFGYRIGYSVNEAWSNKFAQCRRMQRCRRTSEHDPTDVLLAVCAYVIANDKASIGPANKNGTFKEKFFHNGGNIIRPELRILICTCLMRCFRHPMAAEIQRDQTIGRGKLALVLFRPAEMILRPAVDEQD